MGVKAGFERYLRFLIYLVVIILINVVGVTLFFRIDLTANKRYSLSEASKKVVSTLSEPLTINVFFTKNLPAPHNNTERYLRDLLEEYAIHANQYFNYRFYNVSADGEGGAQGAQENRKLANDYGIRPVQIQVVEADEVKFKRAYMGLVLIHGDMIERVPTITSTDGLEYKLTTAIQKLNHKISALLSLPEKVQVTLFLSSSLEQVAPYMGLDDLAAYPAKLEKIIDKINPQAYGNLAYSHVDPSEEAAQEKALAKYQLMSLKWPSIPEDNIPAGTGMIGLVMEYNERVIDIPLLNVFRLPIIGTRYELTGVDELEELINESLESIIDINEDLGYLADHGTLDYAGFNPTGSQSQDTLSNFAALASEHYALKPIELGEDSLAESLNCLVVARPTEKLSDYALYQIDQALMRGTNLALFIDAFEEKAPPAQAGMSFNRGVSYAPLDTGLEKLLEHYGIRIRQSIVLDENCYRQRLQPQMGSGEQAIYYAPLIQSTHINSDLAFMQNIKGLVAIKISPLEIDEKRLQDIGIKATRLFSSSEKSWEMRDNINLNPLFIRPPTSATEQSSMPLAYLLEGSFPSYFAGKPIPVKPAADAEEDASSETEDPEKQPAQADVALSAITRTGDFLASSRPAKIFLMASSEMLKDTVLDREGRSTNAIFVMNILDVLNGRENIAMMRSKEQSFNPLYPTDALTKTFVKSFNIMGLPVLVVLLGVFAWLRRSARKRRIQLMFRQ